MYARMCFNYFLNCSDLVLINNLYMAAIVHCTYISFINCVCMNALNVILHKPLADGCWFTQNITIINMSFS